MVAMVDTLGVYSHQTNEMRKAVLSQAADVLEPRGLPTLFNSSPPSPIPAATVSAPVVLKLCFSPALPREGFRGHAA